MQDVNSHNRDPLEKSSAMAADDRTVYAAIGIVFATIVLIVVFHRSPRLVTVIFGAGISLASIVFSASNHPRKTGWRVAFFVLNVAAGMAGWLIVKTMCPNI